MKPRGTMAGLILAGGASRRMGSPKALLQYQGETFLDRMIRLFSGVSRPVIVVLGYQSDQIRSGIQCGSEAIFAVNPDPERGMLSSLQCGLMMMPAEADGVMFTPVDHPHLEAATLELLASSFQAGQAEVMVPVYHGQHGHPVCISRALTDELLVLPPGAMASDVIHRHVGQTAYLEVGDPAVTTDVDDPESYAELKTRLP